MARPEQRTGSSGNAARKLSWSTTRAEGESRTNTINTSNGLLEPETLAYAIQAVQGLLGANGAGRSLEKDGGVESIRIKEDTTAFNTEEQKKMLETEEGPKKEGHRCLKP